MPPDSPQLESTKIDLPAAPRRHGETVLWLSAIAVFWLQALLHGFERAAVVVAAVGSALFAMVWFLQARSRDRTASRGEIIVATAWRWARLIVGFAAVIVFGGIPIAALILGFPVDSRFLAALLAGVVVAALAVWVAVYGWSRTFIRDPQIHRERKRRYGWRR
jgi:hypothetical protein